VWRQIDEGTEEEMKLKEVLIRLNRLGLDVRKARAGHYKVYDQSHTLLFDVSGTPRDQNWYHGVERDLQKFGLSLYKQDTETQESEVVEKMVEKAPISRVQWVRGRLENFMLEKGDELAVKARKRFPNTRPGRGKHSEFARVAIYEVAPATKLRAWKSQSSAEQSVSHFLRNKETGMSMWALDLIETTMSYINENPEWGNYEIPQADEDDDLVDRIDGSSPASRREDTAQAEKPELHVIGEPLPEGKVDEIDADEVGTINPTYRERYIEALLKMLENGKHSDEVVAMEIMPRLDKLLLGGE
jgi:hypothetical protein